jgi:ribonucleoside-diphosphate reductase alpha chain
MKPAALQKVAGDDAFDMAMPPSGEKTRMPSLVAGFARSFAIAATSSALLPTTARAHPVVDALIGLKEPKTGPDGTLSWTVDKINHNTGDDCVLS